MKGWGTCGCRRSLQLCIVGREDFKSEELCARSFKDRHRGAEPEVGGCAEPGARGGGRRGLCPVGARSPRTLCATPKNSGGKSVFACCEPARLLDTSLVQNRILIKKSTKLGSFIFVHPQTRCLKGDWQLF